MIPAERLRTVYLFAVIAACCLLITGCPKPEDVDCIDLSGRDHHMYRWKRTAVVHGS